jgi:hypothetical protein
MTKTLEAVASKKSKPEPIAEERVAEEIVHRARDQGLPLTGGLLKQPTKMVLGTALDQEPPGHLGMRRTARSLTRPETSATVLGLRRC